MRKKSFILPLIIIILLVLLSFSSCEKKESLTFIINGDIEDVKIIDINNYEKISFKDYDYNKLKGYKLSDIFKDIDTISDENWLLITAKDKVTARIEYDSIDLVYIVEDDKELNIKAPEHPKLVSIKDIEDITIVSKEPIDIGLKVINVDNSVVSYGNMKLMLNEQIAQNYINGNVAYKHLPIDDFAIKELTQEDKNILYFDNKDIKKDFDEGFLVWDEGSLCYKKDEEIFRGVFGIVAGVEHILSDAFYTMKEAIDNNEKVMFILPDGLSMEQVEYHNDLELFNTGYTQAASVHPAISNVALASIITGVSPYKNGITKRGMAPLDVDDIFSYAFEKNKVVKYIEGNSNLVQTTLQPILSAPDSNGYTDKKVFDNSIEALQDDPDLIFIHFHGIDDVNHKYSPISQQAKNKIIETEGYIIELMEEFEGKVIILPDHGAITYYDSENNPKGRHGYFEKDDMIVPYYIYE